MKGFPMRGDDSHILSKRGTQVMCNATGKLEKTVVCSFNWLVQTVKKSDQQLLDSQENLRGTEIKRV